MATKVLADPCAECEEIKAEATTIELFMKEVLNLDMTKFTPQAVEVFKKYKIPASVKNKLVYPIVISPDPIKVTSITPIQ